MSRIDGVGYEIFDSKDNRTYIKVTFDTKQSAEIEKEVLLKGFDTDSPWRKRLTIRRVGAKY